jgi:hypothetical protein
MMVMLPSDRGYGDESESFNAPALEGLPVV